MKKFFNRVGSILMFLVFLNIFGVLDISMVINKTVESVKVTKANGIKPTAKSWWEGDTNKTYTVIHTNIIKKIIVITNNLTQVVSPKIITNTVYHTVTVTNTIYHTVTVTNTIIERPTFVTPPAATIEDKWNAITF